MLTILLLGLLLGPQLIATTSAAAPKEQQVLPARVVPSQLRRIWFPSWIRRDGKGTFAKQPRTVFTTRFPTVETAGEMFRASGRVEFNHDSVGMTKPCLNVTTDKLRDDTTTAVATEKNTEDLDQCWWPGTAFGSGTDLRKSDEVAKAAGWRVLRYRRRVGVGRECYDALRDAVLRWQFSTSNNTDSSNGPKAMGIICAGQVHPMKFKSSPWISHVKGSTKSAIEICVAPGGKKMITYTEARFGIGDWWKFRMKVPSLFAINPVAVVYDVVDGRVPGIIYTSTAYATLRGHLLSGEERVTAILRHADGIRAYVDLEILSYSRRSPSLLGKLVWPLVGKMQNHFFVNQMEHLAKLF